MLQSVKAGKENSKQLARSNFTKRLSQAVSLFGASLDHCSTPTQSAENLTSLVCSPSCLNADQSEHGSGLHELLTENVTMACDGMMDVLSRHMHLLSRRSTPCLGEPTPRGELNDCITGVARQRPCYPPSLDSSVSSDSSTSNSVEVSQLLPDIPPTSAQRTRGMVPHIVHMIQQRTSPGSVTESDGGLSQSLVSVQCSATDESACCSASHNDETYHPDRCDVPKHVLTRHDLVDYSILPTSEASSVPEATQSWTAAAETQHSQFTNLLKRGPISRFGQLNDHSLPDIQAIQNIVKVRAARSVLYILILLLQIRSCYTIYTDRAN